MRRALLIGIDDYPDPNRLTGCVDDVKALRHSLEYNMDGSKNFDVEELINVTSGRIAMGQIETLFSRDLDVALLYFAGHGFVNTTGSELVFPVELASDGYYKGLQMRSIMDIVNRSNAKNKVIILDCCHAGDFGRYDIDIDNSDLRTGVSILSACKGDESAEEENGRGVFTDALCMALNGAAADYSGVITLGGLYSYLDGFFTATEQRPVFKTNTTEFIPIKRVTPIVSDETIHQVMALFPSVDDLYHLDPSYEETNSVEKRPELKDPLAVVDNVSIMKKLQLLYRIGFIEPVGAEYMYNAAMNSKACRLTELGKYYWRIANKSRT